MIISRSFCLLIVATCIVGCDSGPKLPPMQRVTGTVTIDGAPLPRGDIQFEPSSTQGASAVGTIDASGNYELTTAGVKGAIIGTHTVTVSAREVPRDETDTFPKSLIPEKYSQPRESGISKEVTAGAANVINIELSSKP